MRVASVFGIRIILNDLFLLLLLVLGALGRLSEALTVFSLVFLHELGHVAMARRYGLAVAEIELMPFGGVAKISDGATLDPIAERNVAVAGPLANLLLVGLALIWSKLGWISGSWNRSFIETNLLLAIGNLLPAIPLDGGRIYRAHLTQKVGFRRATAKAAGVARMAALCLAVGGMAGVYLGYLNVSAVMLACFVYFAAGQEQKLAPYVSIRFLARKRRELKMHGCMRAEQLVALATTPLNEIAKQFVPKRFHVILVLDESGKVQGHVTESEVLEQLFERGVNVPIVHLLRPPVEPG